LNALLKENFMEVILERVAGRAGMPELRAWLSEASRLFAEARAKRRAEREMARFARDLAGMSEHLRRDVGLEPHLFHQHFALLDRFD
jgi:uncharacterized protein YjiS (DUF1127 family)